MRKAVSKVRILTQRSFSLPARRFQVREARQEALSKVLNQGWLPVRSFRINEIAARKIAILCGERMIAGNGVERKVTGRSTWASPKLSSGAGRSLVFCFLDGQSLVSCFLDGRGTGTLDLASNHALTGDQQTRAPDYAPEHTVRSDESNGSRKKVPRHEPVRRGSVSVSNTRRWISNLGCRWAMQ